MLTQEEMGGLEVEGIAKVAARVLGMAKDSTGRR
jgi:hypothetical protein